jgi:hypothetical protein
VGLEINILDPTAVHINRGSIDANSWNVEDWHEISAKDDRSDYGPKTDVQLDGNEI